METKIVYFHKFNILRRASNMSWLYKLEKFEGTWQDS